jgi:hypothetical protein
MALPWDCCSCSARGEGFIRVGALASRGRARRPDALPPLARRSKMECDALLPSTACLSGSGTSAMCSIERTTAMTIAASSAASTAATPTAPEPQAITPSATIAVEDRSYGVSGRTARRRAPYPSGVGHELRRDRPTARDAYPGPPRNCRPHTSMRSTIDSRRPPTRSRAVDPDESVAAGSAPTPPPPAAALPPLRGLRLLSLELGLESRPATRRSGAPRSGRSLHRAGYAG